MFRHELLLYSDLNFFVPAVGGFLSEGLDRGERALAILPTTKAESLTRFLGGKAQAVEFIDMEQVGRNPARLLSLWLDFEARSEIGARGVGEPTWAGRTPDEVVEYQLHEALMNRVLGTDSRLRLMCPYDVSALDTAIIETARTEHPDRPASHSSPPASDPRSYWSLPLPGRGDAKPIEFDANGIRSLRTGAREVAESAGMPPERVEDLVLAVSEVATNSVLHGGGRGVAWLWVDPVSMRVMVEVADIGHLSDPLIGRFPSGVSEARGRGLWIANQLCDLVQIRTTGDGTVVRLQMRLAP